MIRLVSGSVFALLVSTSVQAMSPAPMPRADGMITRVAFGCGIGQTMVNGECVARTDIRQARRAVRREAYGVGAPGGDLTRVYVTPNVGTGYGYGYGYRQPYYTEPHYSPYMHHTDVTSQPWHAVKAYYAGGPWYYGSNGWADYAAHEGIGCTPGTLIKGGDGIMYVCQ